MRWFLRSAVAAAGFGAIGAFAIAQSAGPLVPTLDMRPAPAPTPTATRVEYFLPPIPVAPGGAQEEALPPDRVLDVSPKKPAPSELVQAAVPTYPKPAPPAPKPGPMPEAVPPLVPPVQRTAGQDEEPPTARPDRLPPFIPPKPELPEPPAPNPLPLPSIPVAPLPAKPQAAAPSAQPPDTLPPVTQPPAMLPPSFPPVPPLPKPTPAKVAPDAGGAAVEAPYSATERLKAVTYDDPVWHLFPQDGAVRFRGWLDAGYVYNSSNPDSKFNGPYNSIDRSAEPMFNQAYAILDRPLPASGSFGVGFRIDALFGYDFFLGQSRGLEVGRDGTQRWNGQYYGLAIPQAYLEAGGELISVKLGHFYTLVGYESLPATSNFFYSHAYSYQFGQPFTHWGGLITTQLTRNVQVQLGGVNGWNTLDGRENNFNFLGSIKYIADSGNWWSSFALITGDEENNPGNLPLVNRLGTNGNRTMYSFLLGLTPGGSCGRWEYVFHHFYGWQENGAANRDFARWYGIDQYLYYRASKSVRLGARFEWFRDEDGTRVGLNRAANLTNPPLPGNYFSLTGGVNYAPTANLMFRPELRWDFTSDTLRPAFNDGKKNNQLLLAMDVLWQF